MYTPEFFTRVRLTYSNVINRAELGLEGVEWPELLQPYIACELASDMSERIQGVRSDVVVILDDANGQVL